MGVFCAPTQLSYHTVLQAVNLASVISAVYTRLYPHIYASFHLANCKNYGII